MSERKHFGGGAQVAIGLGIAAVVAACSSNGEPDASGSEAALVGDITSVVQADDGTFDVTCKSGAIEHRVTADDIRHDRVCRGAHTKPLGAACDPPYSDRNLEGVQQCVVGGRCLWVGASFKCTDKKRPNESCTNDAECLSPRRCEHGRCAAPSTPPAPAAGTPDEPLHCYPFSGVPGYTQCCCPTGYHCSVYDQTACIHD